MHAFKSILSVQQQERIRALDVWHSAFENRTLRMNCPDAYHEELLRQTDEMDRRGIIDWAEWRDLRMADHAYSRAIAGEDYRKRLPMIF